MPRKLEFNAPGLLESLSSTGYSLEAAISDIIDNSIDAKSKQIWINFFFAGLESTISVFDNGKGMTQSELEEGLKPGTQISRSEMDRLGRFGLGLKSASFSQCSEFTVATKKLNSKISTMGYDKSVILNSKTWSALEENDYSEEYLSDLHENFSDVEQGTLVFWKNLRVCQDWVGLDLETQRSEFLNLAETCEYHIRMTFHRFMDQDEQLAFYINGNKLEPWDPFATLNESTQALPPETFTLNGKVISISPYVLPPRRKLSEREAEDLAGPHGWIAQQGFYIYRNKRLVVPGSWLDIPKFTKDEKHYLARVKVDIPAGLDEEWKINVMKSSVITPTRLKPAFARNGKAVRNKARQVLDSIAGVSTAIKSNQTDFIWNINDSNGRVRIKLNWDHPLIKHALDLDLEKKRLIRDLMKLIEETVPMDAARLVYDHEKHTVYKAFDEMEDLDLITLAERIFETMVSSGTSPSIAAKNVLSSPYFRDYQETLNASGVLQIKRGSLND